MSNLSPDFNPIFSVTKTFSRILYFAIKADLSLAPLFSEETQISYLSSKNLTANSHENLTLFLYNISEVTIMKNTPQEPNRRPPIFLSLHYLLTPCTQDPESDQILLADIIKVFLDNPVLSGSLLQGSLAGTDAQLRITLDSLSLDDQNKLWSMFSVRYMTSIGYTVSPLMIDATPPDGGNIAFGRKIVGQPLVNNFGGP